jgi:hypothetical protein
MRVFNDCGIEQMRRVFVVPYDAMVAIQREMQQMVGMAQYT